MGLSKDEMPLLVPTNYETIGSILPKGSSPLLPNRFSAYRRVIVAPEKVTRRPWEAFNFTCTASEKNRPLVVLKGTNTQIDGLFGLTINRPSENTITVTADRGLREIHGNVTFE